MRIAHPYRLIIWGLDGGDMNYFLLFTILFALSTFSLVMPQTAYAEAFEHSSIKKNKRSSDVTADRGSEYDPYRDLHGGFSH